MLQGSGVLCAWHGAPVQSGVETGSRRDAHRGQARKRGEGKQRRRMRTGRLGVVWWRVHGRYMGVRIPYRRGSIGHCAWAWAWVHGQRARLHGHRAWAHRRGVWAHGHWAGHMGTGAWAEGMGAWA
eukprot:184907-Chlamydomonas_euryale.AAC.6